MSHHTIPYPGGIVGHTYTLLHFNGSFICCYSQASLDLPFTISQFHILVLCPNELWPLFPFMFKVKCSFNQEQLGDIKMLRSLMPVITNSLLLNFMFNTLQICEINFVDFKNNLSES